MDTRRIPRESTNNDAKLAKSCFTFLSTRLLIEHGLISLVEITAPWKRVRRSGFWLPQAFVFISLPLMEGILLVYISRGHSTQDIIRAPELQITSHLASRPTPSPASLTTQYLPSRVFSPLRSPSTFSTARHPTAVPRPSLSENAPAVTNPTRSSASGTSGWPDISVLFGAGGGKGSGFETRDCARSFLRVARDASGGIRGGWGRG